MDQPLDGSAMFAAPGPETQPKKRHRPDDDDASSLTDAPAHDALPNGAGLGPRPSSRVSLRQGGAAESDDASLANGSISPFSLSDSVLPEPFSPPASIPRFSIGPRASLSPPYMFSGPSRPPDYSQFEVTDGGCDGSSDSDEMEERAGLAQAEEGDIVVDSDDTGTDAGYSTDGSTAASTSLAESMRDYVSKNGRRYRDDEFRQGRYDFLNDDAEQGRENMKHAMVKMLCGQLYFAPIGDCPRQILDMGTGTGIWAMEMGELFPDANVLGVDLSPVQPELAPPNVRFMVDDVESPWLHPRNYFDYIHAGHIIMAIKDWPKLMRRTLEHLRPGGWFEMHEINHFPISARGLMPADHPVARYWTLVNEGLAKLGVDLQAAAGGRLADTMRECGFVNVTERVLHVPLGTWPRNRLLKTVGRCWRSILADGARAIALGPLTRGCGWSPDQVDLLLADVRKTYRDNAALCYMPLHIVYGQKPQNY